MRRIFGTMGLSLAIGGAAALTPLFATIGAGMTLTAVSLAYGVWRWIGRRNARSSTPVGREGGVRSA